MTKRTECLTPTILLITVASIILACPRLLAQTTPAAAAPSSPATGALPAPSFDVATIKPHPSASSYSFLGIRATPDGVSALSPLRNLVLFAYTHQIGDQVSGGPDWAKADQFDVQAKMSEADIVAMQKLKPAEAAARSQLMMQTLLAERFRLKVHSEAGQAPIYELVVAKGGPKMEVAATDASGEQHVGMMFRNDRGVARGVSMQSLAGFLSTPNGGMGRPVIDKTGLSGTYNFTLNSSWCGAPPCGPDYASAMFSALQELGLKLQPATGAIEIIVIDHAERPSEN